MDTDEDVISKSLQLVAGRTAQEYNIRKKRKGAFWEDRYHATVIQSDEHLAKCMVYIDLNMVRADVVRHPSEYNPCGYNEIQNPAKRYRIIDPKALRDYFSIDDERTFQQDAPCMVEEELKNDKLQKSRIWSEAIAIGNEDFIENIHRQLKEKNTVGRNVTCGSMTVLQEPHSAYNTLFDAEKGPLSYFALPKRIV